MASPVSALLWEAEELVVELQQRMHELEAETPDARRYAPACGWPPAGPEAAPPALVGPSVVEIEGEVIGYLRLEVLQAELPSKGPLLQTKQLAKLLEPVRLLQQLRPHALALDSRQLATARRVTRRLLAISTPTAVTVRT